MGVTPEPWTNASNQTVEAAGWKMRGPYGPADVSELGVL